MKNNPQTSPLLFRIIILVTCFMMVILYNQSRAAGLPTSSRSGTKVAVNFKNDMHALIMKKE